MFRYTGTLALLATLLTAELKAQATPTIPEIVSRGWGWVGPSKPSGTGPDMHDVLRRTDTIVRGIIGQPLPSYLSRDQREVYTDYPVRSPWILYQEVLVPSPIPGLLPNVTVVVRGGAVVIKGVPFTAEYRGQPEMTPGSECVFLLNVGR
jgi:hypothetical protein